VVVHKTRHLAFWNGIGAFPCHPQNRSRELSAFKLELKSFHTRLMDARGSYIARTLETSVRPFARR